MIAYLRDFAMKYYFSTAQSSPPSGRMFAVISVCFLLQWPSHSRRRFHTIACWPCATMSRSAFDVRARRVAFRARRSSRAAWLRWPPYDQSTHCIRFFCVLMLFAIQLYDTGACVYFYFGFIFKGLKDPSRTFSEVEHEAREEVLKCGGSLSHHHGLLATSCVAFSISCFFFAFSQASESYAKSFCRSPWAQLGFIFLRASRKISTPRIFLQTAIWFESGLFLIYLISNQKYQEYFWKRVFAKDHTSLKKRIHRASGSPQF